MRVETPATPKSSIGRSVGSLLFVLIWPALILLLAGDVRWIEGWIFSAWLLGVYALITAWMYLADPALLAERRRHTSKDPGPDERRDRLLLIVMFLAFVAWFVLMPLDAKRFEWTPAFSPMPKAIGIALLLLSSFFLFRSFRDNTFLSGFARIQAERRQVVVSTGVYAIVRHPMYLGMILMAAGAPLLLGSLAGLLPAAAIAIVLAIRITRDERMLVRELEGYEDYRRRVRWRLLPFIW